MSRAFVKEEDGARWEGPSPRRAYALVWTGDGLGGEASEVMRETDDLLDALRWLAGRGRAGFELRDASGVVLARSEAGVSA